MTYNTHSRGGSRNSSRGASGPEFLLQRGGGVRVHVRRNFYILTRKKTGGLTP